MAERSAIVQLSNLQLPQQRTSSRIKGAVAIALTRALDAASILNINAAQQASRVCAHSGGNAQDIVH